jgi:hypothetical protein
MILSGRRRSIISGSDVNNATATLNAQPKYSASFHSTSTISDNNDLVYYDYDMQDIDHWCKIVQEIDEISAYHQDYGWAVEPDYPSPTGSNLPPL